MTRKCNELKCMCAYFYQIPPVHQKVLTVIGQVFVSISLVFLLATILTFVLQKLVTLMFSPIYSLTYAFTDRSLWNMRNYIHCMLCANLIAAQLVFVVGVERTENEVKSVLLSLIIHSPAHCRLSVQPLLCCSTTCSWWCSCGC